MDDIPFYPEDNDYVAPPSPPHAAEEAESKKRSAVHTCCCCSRQFGDEGAAPLIDTVAADMGLMREKIGVGKPFCSAGCWVGYLGEAFAEHQWFLNALTRRVGPDVQPHPVTNESTQLELRQAKKKRPEPRADVEMGVN